MRVVTVFVAFLGWLLLSNHCVLSEIVVGKSTPPAASERSCCHRQPAPTKGEHPKQPMLQECCKSLHAVVPDAAKLPTAIVLEVIVPAKVELNFSAISPGAHVAGAPPTGPPPDGPTFVDLVLHRSLRSHAPPIAA